MSDLFQRLDRFNCNFRPDAITGQDSNSGSHSYSVSSFRFTAPAGFAIRHV